MPKTEYQFLVNALGELSHSNAEKEAKFPSYQACVHKVSLDVFSTEQRNTWLCPKNNKERIRLNGIVRKAADKEYDRRLKLILNEKEYAMYSRIHSLQRLNTNRFRIYGGIFGDRWLIKLVTEFVYFTDQKHMRSMIQDIANNFAAKIELMDEDEYLDSRGNPARDKHGKFKKKRLDELVEKLKKEGRFVLDSGKPDKNGYIWSLGPNHGRKETQVEMWWDIVGMLDGSVKERIELLRKATQEAWDYCGVGVS